MRTLVIYYSKTGNTGKIAEAIATELDAALRTIDEPGDITFFDLICVGTPVRFVLPIGRMRSFLRRLPKLDGQKVAGFCTMAIVGGRITLNYMRRVTEGKGAKFIGSFACRASSGIIAGFGPKLWMKTHPDEEDLWKAKEFARKLAGVR